MCVQPWCQIFIGVQASMQKCCEGNTDPDLEVLCKGRGWLFWANFTNWHPLRQPSHAWCKCTALQHGDALFCVGFMGVCAPPPKTLFYLEHKVDNINSQQQTNQAMIYASNVQSFIFFHIHMIELGPHEIF